MREIHHHRENRSANGAAGHRFLYKGNSEQRAARRFFHNDSGRKARDTGAHRYPEFQTGGEVRCQPFDTIAVPSMVPANDHVIVVVDEIGKMECVSELFRQTLLKILDSANILVGSIALRGDAFSDAIRKRPDTLLITVSEKNRNDLVEEFFARQGSIDGLA